MLPTEASPGVFSVVVHLPAGYHQYKFIVDGEWRHDETQPFMPDPLGNVNNWLFVRRPDGTHGSPTAHGSQMTLQQQHAAAAAQQLSPAALPAVPPIQIPGGLSQQLGLAAAPHSPGGAGTAALGMGSPHTSGDVDMPMAESSTEPGRPGTPIVVQADDPEYTRKKVRDFLHSHTAYELMPESGKVVLLDTDLPIRQALHALHDQGLASAPLWDSETASVPGMISASDFIQILRQLRTSVSSGANALSEAEMDRHTIRGLREDASAEGRVPKPLVFVRPEEHMGMVVERLFSQRCSMAPILSGDPNGNGEVCTLLHIATMSGVLSCLLRHFRASLSCLPLLAQPLGCLPLGTWSADSPLVQQHSNGPQHGEERKEQRKVRRLHTVLRETPLTTALGLLLEAGVSALPVVDESGALLDVYARADITALCRSNAYNRLQWEDVTVGQALALGELDHRHQPLSGPNSAHGQRVHMVHPGDSLRSIVERLAQPGVRRLIIVDPDTKRVEGLVSLSDVAAYLFL